jgi:TonB family protein
VRPVILLPAEADDWDDEKARVVLAHEVAHIHRHDWVVQLLAECLRAAYWFNPLFWIACVRLRREGELACDDRVLGTGVQPAAYATCVVQFARRSRRPVTPGWSGVMPMARRPALERRIAAMLNVSTNRTPLSRGLVAVAIALATFVTVPGAAMRLAPAQAQHLEGSVYDTSGAVLPEVALTLHDATDQTLAAFTDAEGHFVFPNVAAGTYVLEAKLRGFKALTQEFTLTEPKDWDRAVTLQVGTLQETIRVTANRVVGSASAAAPRPARLRVGGNIRAPRKLVDVKPVYPTTMREAGREGEVALEAIIGTDGAVHSLRVLGAHVHPDFAIAAGDAVRQWRFSPTLLNGEPIEVVMDVSIGFSLQD